MGENYEYSSTSTYRSRTDLALKNPSLALQIVEDRHAQCLRVLKERYGIESYFLRREFQQRGSLHLHALIKFPNAPDMDSIAKNPN